MQSFIICTLKTRITKITCCLVGANDGDFFLLPLVLTAQIPFQK